MGNSKRAAGKTFRMLLEAMRASSERCQVAYVCANTREAIRLSSAVKRIGQAYGLDSEQVHARTVKISPEAGVMRFISKEYYEHNKITYSGYTKFFDTE